MTTPDAPLVFIVTGEPSGDLLAARLMRALRAETGGQVRFAGVGGEAMAEEGLDSLVDLSDLAIMGFLEVLPKLRRLLGHLDHVVEAILTQRPAVVITVDSWGFTGRLHKRLKARGAPMPRLHYVAPQVWAWKEKRAETVAGLVDHLLCLLPNEPSYFTPFGLPCTHVGHPVVEGGAARGDGAAFRAAHDIPADAPVLAVLPGSRRTETSRLLPVFADVVRRLSQEPDAAGLRVVVPTVATVAAPVREAVARWAVPVTVVQGEAARYDAFAAATAALAASGTVSLELALAGVPHLVAYRVNPLSAWLFRRISKVRYVNLVNLTLDRPVVPELLQENCSPSLLAECLKTVMIDDPFRAQQRAAFAEALAVLAGPGEGTPSQRAAQVVARAMTEGVQRP